MSVAKVDEQPLAGEICGAHHAAVGIDKGQGSLGREAQFLGRARQRRNRQHGGEWDLRSGFGRIKCHNRVVQVFTRIAISAKRELTGFL